MCRKISSQMRAVMVKDGRGSSANLYIGEALVPQLDDDEVLVKIEAFGLNRMDIRQREGLYNLPPHAPQIMGVEFSGHIVATKNLQDSKWKEGDEVFGLAVGGAYAEYIKVSARMVLNKPPQLSWVQAAAIPETYLTAFQALRRIACMKKGESVLIHAGASGVGIAAIQLAKVYGADKIFVTAGSQDKVDFCQRIGATKGFNYKASDWADQLAQYTAAEGENCAGSVDVIIDVVGAPYLAGNMRSLKKDGRLVVLAFMGGAQLREVEISQILYKRLRIEGSTLRSRTIGYQSDLVQDFVKEKGIERLIMGCSSSDEGGSQIIIHKVYSWKCIKEAHDEMEANRTVGKIVVTIDDY